VNSGYGSNRNSNKSNANGSYRFPKLSGFVAITQESQFNQGSKEFFDEITKNPDTFLDVLSNYSFKTLKQSQDFEKKINTFKSLVNSFVVDTKNCKKTMEKFTFAKMEHIVNDIINTKNTLFGTLIT